MTLFELIGLLRKHLALLFILPVLTGAIAFAYASTLPNEYNTTTTMYVLSRNNDLEQEAASPSSGAVTPQELSFSSMLTGDVETIINSVRVKENVAARLGLSNLGGYQFAVARGASSRVISLTISGRDPEMCATIANAVVEEANSIASQIMQIQAINVIDVAKIPTNPSGPNRQRYIMIGAAAGLFAAIAIIIVRDLLDTRVRNGKEAEEIIGVPVVGHYPEFD